MILKVVCKVKVSGGILKSCTVIRECNTKKNLIGISKGKLSKNLSERVEL